MHRCSYNMRRLRRVATLESFALLGALSQTTLAQTPLPAFNGGMERFGVDRSRAVSNSPADTVPHRVIAACRHSAADTLCNGAAGCGRGGSSQ